jgi:hypothetical protein
MDLLDHVGQTRNNAQQPNSTRDRGSSGGQTPSVLLAWLPAPSTQREEVVQYTSALVHAMQPAPLGCRLRTPPRSLRAKLRPLRNRTVSLWLRGASATTFSGDWLRARVRERFEMSENYRQPLKSRLFCSAQRRHCLREPYLPVYRNTRTPCQSYQRISTL